MALISGNNCEFILEFNIPTQIQVIFTEILINISFQGETRARVMIDSETSPNYFTASKDINNSLSDSTDKNSYRNQSIKVVLQKSFNKLKFRKMTEGNIKIALSSKSLGCPLGSELNGVSCKCKTGYYQVADISEFVCYKCPPYCSSCTATTLMTCPAYSEYSECKFHSSYILI